MVISNPFHESFESFCSSACDKAALVSNNGTAAKGAKLLENFVWLNLVIVRHRVLFEACLKVCCQNFLDEPLNMFAPKTDKIIEETICKSLGTR